MIDGSEVAPRRRYAALLAALAAASFLLYAAGVLALRQDRLPGWALEAEGPIPAAVSHLLYGTHFGAVDLNVEARFMRRGGMSVQEVLALAASKSIPAGSTNNTTIDGTGAGTDVFAIVAMAMFGPHLLSLVLLYLLTVGIAAAAFVVRYRDRRSLVVPLYFLVVTVMLLTPFVTSAMAVDQAPIGGQRYFVLAAFLPALHIFFELIDRSPAGADTRDLAKSLPLFIQALLLLMSLLVRSSTGYLVMIIVAALAWRFRRTRAEPAPRRALWRKIKVLASACGIFAAVIAVALPAYVQKGRLFGTVWHRAFSTLSINPEWPFGDLAKVYDCTKYFPYALGKGSADADGQCVWWAYPPNATRPPFDVVRGTYDGEYETVVRRAYFYVLFHYPRQVFETYAFVKSRVIANVVTAAWHALFELRASPVAPAVFAMAAAQLLVFAAFVIAVAVAERTVVDWRMAVFPAAFLLSFLPLYVAVASGPTSLDMVFLMYSCLVLAVLLGCQLLARLLTARAMLPSAGPVRPAGG